MPKADWQWIKLAGDFPPTLVTNAPATDLDVKQTPDATGISLTTEGYLVADVDVPPATATTAKTYVIGPTTYNWWYNRLWRVNTSSPKLLYGAPEYTGTFLPQGLGEVDFRNEAGNVLTVMPIGTGGLIVFKAAAAGAYIVPNAADPSGRFVASELITEAGILAATDAVEMEGIVYFRKASGESGEYRLFAIGPDGQVHELSFALRGTTVVGTLAVDFKQKLVLATGGAYDLAYDVQAKRWAKYDGATTSYTTRALCDPVRAPISITGVAFDYDNTAASDLSLVYQTRYDARAWSDDQTVAILYDRSTHNYAMHQPPADTGTQFQIKVTTLPAGLKVRAIYVRVSGYTPESRRS